MTTITNLPSSRKTIAEYYTSGEVVVATGWLVLYVVILGITLATEVLLSSPVSTKDSNGGRPTAHESSPHQMSGQVPDESSN